MKYQLETRLARLVQGSFFLKNTMHLHGFDLGKNAAISPSMSLVMSFLLGCKRDMGVASLKRLEAHVYGNSVSSRFSSPFWIPKPRQEMKVLTLGTLKIPPSTRWAQKPVISGVIPRHLLRFGLTGPQKTNHPNTKPQEV